MFHSGRGQLPTDRGASVVPASYQFGMGIFWLVLDRKWAIGWELLPIVMS
jgi:hypothetical protein